MFYDTVSFDIGPNTLQVLLAIIAVIPGVIAAIFAYKANNKADANGDQGKQTHDLVNSRMDELLTATNAASKAEGVAEATSATNAAKVAATKVK